MKLAWYAVTVGAVLGAACFEPTATRIQGIGTISGPATVRLAFTVQPSGAIVDEIITPAVQVAAQDSLGNTDLTFVGNVTVGLGTNPVGANLEGSRTVGVVFGVASFGDLSVDKVGTGYRLVATASGATAATSAPFNITAREP
jgi:hypothetical protein